jgi:hypothetical protein
MDGTRYKHLLIFLCIVALFPSCSRHKEGDKALSRDADDERAMAQAPGIQYPSDQMTFHQTNLHFRYELHSATTDAQRSAILDECDKARAQFFKERKKRIDNWVGKIAEVRNENKGAWTFLRIVSEAGMLPVSYQTHYQRWPTWKENSVIDKGTKPYQQVAHLVPGQTVTFSGTFVESIYDKYTETKVLDLPSVNSPSVVIKFISIAPLSSTAK